METSATAKCLSLLREYQSLTKELVFSILQVGRGQKDVATPEELMKKLLEKDKELQKTVKQVEEHQRFQQKIGQVQKEIEDKDKLVANLVLELHKAEKVLQEIVEKGRAKLAIFEQAEEGAIPPEDLVEYSHKISCTTSGPSGWTPASGQPLIMYKPPAPQEDEMRSGILYSKQQ